MQPQTNKPRMYKVLTPIEKKEGGTFWMRVGTAFPAKTGTAINLFLDALPAGEKPMLHIREMDERDLERGEGRARPDRRNEPGPATPGTDDLPF